MIAASATAVATTTALPAAPLHDILSGLRRLYRGAFRSVLPAFSVSIVALRVASCPLPNRARCHRPGLGEREEQSFFGSRRARRPLDLVSRASLCGRTSPQPCCRSGQGAPSAQRTYTSTAIANRPTKSSWPCSTSSARASALESQAKATRGKPGIAGADGAVRQNNRREGLRVGEPTRIGMLSWPALGRTSNVSELGVTGGEGAAQNCMSGWSSPVARLAHNQEVARSNRAPATSFRRAA